MKIFAKNPQKGGTPAIDKKTKINVFVKIWVDPNSANVYKVLELKLINCIKVKNSTNNDKL